ncbi:MAG: response regulator transcription factor [Rhodothermales bacterium]|nr:response regulator transcription factor [Rhodothermales bacterium]
MSSQRHRVLLVDDHPIVRRGLRQLFDDEPGFEVCGEAEDAAAAFAEADRLRPDLAVVDLSLKGTSGIELTRQLHAYYPAMPVLVLSLHDERLYAERALRAGASGYVMKSRSDDEILRAARQVLGGGTYLSEAVQARRDAPHADPASPVEQLSNREFEVFRLIGQGFAPRHIAERLHLSVSTVEVYRQHLKEKLNVPSAALLRRYAIEWLREHEGP